MSTNMERHLGHKTAIALGLLALAGMLNGVLGTEDPGPGLIQWSGLIGAPLAFGIALLVASGKRAAYSVGAAYLGAVVAAPVLHALVLLLTGNSPSAGALGGSFGFGVGAGLPYLLIAYGWKGTESSDTEGGVAAGGSE